MALVPRVIAMTVKWAIVPNIMAAGMAYITTTMRCSAVTMAAPRPDSSTAAMITTLMTNLAAPMLTIRPNDCGAAMTAISQSRVKATRLARYGNADTGNGQNSQYSSAVVTDYIHGLASEFNSVCVAIKKHTKITLNRG